MPSTYLFSPISFGKSLIGFNISSCDIFSDKQEAVEFCSKLTWNILLIKFRYFEKATKLERNLPIFWHFYIECQNIVAWILNFNKKMEELSSKSLVIKKYIMLLHNLFFPIVPAIVGRHLFRSMLEKKSTEKSKESWSLTFFSKVSNTLGDLCKISGICN